ncbi:hypothetical protein [Maribacter cobaltidurans]|uniref:Uncharacterized protein n=1 Tax=Maribacter cobaltidurans TaxID=1178778 RepID=A0A223V8Z3_9FLAO|nr:hypothetical protein [Maribacter cobaltidurans]ASV31782.1 hypothetical protein CJ263_17035 [Maribacter cobaltidurans]GGD93082.1 hypothetical protein GCM10011412_33750 [Maribacter cobaltidurans]
MKLGKLLWIIGSVMINITVGIYIYLSSKAPLDPVERHEYVNDNWQIYGMHWKAEFLFMTMIAIGALYFAFKLKEVSWAIISVGQLILLTTYPIMLGGYQNTTFEMSEMANQMATVVFVFGNLIFLGGLLKLYISDTYLKKWLKWTAIVLSGITFLTFFITYVDIIDWQQALMIGPLINILYLINAFYGAKIKVD